MLDHILVWAQEGGKTGPAPSPLLDPLLFLPIVFILFFVLVILPNRRRERRERESLLTGLKKNDKVLTVAGIYGTVVSVSDKEDEVVIKIDDNARVRMTKGSIARNLTAEENAKAQQGQKDTKKEGDASPTAIRKA